MLPGVKESMHGPYPQMAQASEPSTWDYFKKGWTDAGGMSSLPGILGDVIKERLQPPTPMPGYPHGIIPGLPPSFPSQDKLPGTIVMDDTGNVGGLLSTLLKQQRQS